MAVIKAIKAGRIAKEADGSIDAAKADAQWAGSTDMSRNPAKVEKARPAEETPQAGPNYTVSRAVREAYTARLAKLEYEEKTGTLVKSDDVKLRWFNTLRIVRDRMLQMPNRLASTFAAELDANKIKTAMDAEIRRILDDAANEVAKQD